MADTMQFNLVSPERSVAAFQASSVQIPGADGDMTAMADHAPTITTLRPGVLRVEGPDGLREFVVTGGFAEIGSEGVTVLAEESISRENMTQEHIDRMVADAAAAHDKARETFKNEPGPVDDAAKLLADMVAMGTEIGLSTKQSNL
ncbi:F0F1 ATP synthase subunit epsilon [Profundibacterium mesophilum]|uniref:ATP synthase epsilon chain n=1 Tax=Profundibacterium mesophilum KAUST100406-0324 TaxID=1037889 RepID=A0A921NWE7_9RHOB|nr:F0F1 ATP synthase subunit epsilon [Profundibacterium mesophilum]KAF0676908.1 F-type H+-transporting ATPase subunit epsilon [Profundibacterium mesophilum KAUST100406-0324]